MSNAEPPPEPPPLPSTPVPALPVPALTEHHRQAAVDRIQRALAEDRVKFEELDERFGAVYRATTVAELETVVADLPAPAQPPPPVAAARHLAPRRSFALIGETKIGGWLALDGDIEATAGIGDIVIDLSSAAIPSEGITVTVRALIGDVKVIVPDGARLQVSMMTLIGDRKERLAPGVEDGPVVRLRIMTLIGDAAVYSLSQVPVGALRKLWTALRRSP